MGKYYRISLNCARVKSNAPFDNECGFIRILPLKGTIAKKGLFGVRYIPTIEYEGHFLIIAEQVDNHFEDVVLRKRIDYDPNGIIDITQASFDELLGNLKRGLTCYNMIEIQPEVALHYENMIKTDINILNKYQNELNEIEKRENVIQELTNRLDMENINNNEKSKKRLLNRKSA